MFKVCVATVTFAAMSSARHIPLNHDGTVKSCKEACKASHGCRDHGYSYCKSNGHCYGLYWINKEKENVCYHRTDKHCDGPELEIVGCHPHDHKHHKKHHGRHEHGEPQPPVYHPTKAATSAPDVDHPTKAATSAPDVDHPTKAATSAPDVDHPTKAATSAPEAGTTPSVATEKPTQNPLSGKKYCGVALNGLVKLEMSFSDKSFSLHVGGTVGLDATASDVPFTLEGTSVNFQSCASVDSMLALVNEMLTAFHFPPVSSSDIKITYDASKDAVKGQIGQFPGITGLTTTC